MPAFAIISRMNAQGDYSNISFIGSESLLNFLSNFPTWHGTDLSGSGEVNMRWSLYGILSLIVLLRWSVFFDDKLCRLKIYFEEKKLLFYFIFHICISK